MQVFLLSTLTVALAEIGDKTQLLSLILATKYKQPWPIIIGLLLATLANHALAGSIGAILMRWVDPNTLKWMVAASFFAVAAWTLIPDKLDATGSKSKTGYGVLTTTLISFFLAEMGDKTQVATIVLAAEYQPLWQVIAGTTIGMLAANVPVVVLGARFAEKLPLKAARICASLLFTVLALWIFIK